jgi:pimeloyl-ACP methyl ester carboxylesterase
VRDAAVSADGILISYEVHGGGDPALVFVHGWSCDRSYWSRQLPHFADRYRVVAMDLAGHGESGGGRGSWTMTAFGQDVVAVVDRLELDEMVLVGHSMGGDVIAEAAIHMPDRVVGVVWADTYNTLGEPLTREQIDSFLDPFRGDFVTATRQLVRTMFMPGSDPDLVERVAAGMSAAPPDVALDSLEKSIGNEPAVLAALRKLAAPVVAINPDYRPTDLAALQSHGVKAILMSGVGHFEMMEDPSTFNRLLYRTIQEFRSTGLR